MNHQPERFYLSALGIVNAIGQGPAAVLQGALAGDTSGMVLESGWLRGPNASQARVGRVRGQLPPLEALAVPDRCRNNQLLIAAWDQIRDKVEVLIQRYGKHRIGVVLGTSTSGIAEGEAAVAHWQASGQLLAGYDYAGQQQIGAPALFLARHAGLSGPAFTISTACTSSAKAFASARNLLRLQLCDAVLVGGVDSLCKLTINGFTALESTTVELTNPLSRNRRGINIGEGAALFILSREQGPVALLGVGEASDAHHISAPHPEGRGAEAAIRAALSDAKLSVSDVGYVNLHATATPKNDEMESKTMARIFPDGVSVSGTKPMTGHTLGAAGATELALCYLVLTQAGPRRLPPHVWDKEPDPALPSLQLIEPGQLLGAPVCMSNSFAFGGSNASILIGALP